MLPNPNHPPTPSAQGASDQSVTHLIPRKFHPPKLRIVLGLRGVERTAVPKTPVHEYRHPEFLKNKIRFAEDRHTTPPADYAKTFEDPHQPKFRILVP